MIPHSPSLKSVGLYEVMGIVNNISPLRENLEIGGYTVNVSSDRLLCLKRSQKCVTCGIEGTVFSLDVPRTNNPSKAEYNAPHLNLYSAGGMLMTIDHVIPKSKGGEDELSNFQTMCARCNGLKGDGENGGFKERKFTTLDVLDNEPEPVWMRPDAIPFLDINFDFIVEKVKGFRKVLIETESQWFYVSANPLNKIGDTKKCALCSRTLQDVVVVRGMSGKERATLIPVSGDRVPMRMTPIGDIEEGKEIQKALICERCKPSRRTARNLIAIEETCHSKDDGVECSGTNSSKGYDEDE